MINNLIKQSQQYSYYSHKVSQDREQSKTKRQLKWFQHDGLIQLNIVYPIQLKYRYINEVLHHLVTTINKSPYISFLVKLQFNDNSPLSLTFYYTALSSPSTTNQVGREESSGVNCNSLMGLTDLIYERILFICESHSISQSLFSQADKLLQYMESWCQQQKVFLSQMMYLAGQSHDTGSHHQAIVVEICQ